MKHNTVRLHLTLGDLAALEAALPEQVWKRSEAQHIVARLVSDARPQLEAQLNAAGKEGAR